MKYAAVIFDMDGLLIDSERIAFEAFIEACTCFDFEADPSVYLRCIGSNAARTREILLEGYGESFPAEKIERYWTEIYMKAAYDKPVPLKKGVNRLLRYLQEAALPMAVATSTAYGIAERKLTNAGIIEYFQLITGGDQVSKSKPDPEIYLLAAQRLGVAPGRCLALEDSDNGVRAAYAAGMDVVQVPDLVKPSESLLHLNHLIVDSLEEVPALISE